jgi:hypothetical protein
MKALELNIKDYGFYNNSDYIVFNEVNKQKMENYKSNITQPFIEYIYINYKIDITDSLMIQKKLMIHLKDFMDKLYIEWMTDYMTFKKILTDIKNLKDQIKKETNKSIKTNLQKELTEKEREDKELKGNRQTKYSNSNIKLEEYRPLEMLNYFFNTHPFTHQYSPNLTGGFDLGTSGDYDDDEVDIVQQTLNNNQPFIPHIQILNNKINDFLRLEGVKDPSQIMDGIIKEIPDFILYLYLDSLKDYPAQISIFTFFSSTINTFINSNKTFSPNWNIKFDFSRIRTHVANFENTKLDKKTQKFIIANNKKAVLSKFIKDNIFKIHYFLAQQEELVRNNKPEYQYIIKEYPRFKIAIKLFLQENLGIIEDAELYFNKLASEESTRIVNEYFQNKS